MKYLKTMAIGLMMMALGVAARGQSAENLNLNRVVQPPYNCYGRLADGCPNAEKLGWSTFKRIFFFFIILRRNLFLRNG